MLLKNGSFASTPSTRWAIEASANAGRACAYGRLAANVRTTRSSARIHAVSVVACFTVNASFHQRLGAGRGDFAVGLGAAAGHRRPAAAAHVAALLPARHFLERREAAARLGAVLELRHADGNQRSEDRRVCACAGEFLRRAPGHPAAPIEADEGERDGARDRAPEERTRLRAKL